MMNPNKSKSWILEVLGGNNEQLSGINVGSTVEATAMMADNFGRWRTD